MQFTTEVHAAKGQFVQRQVTAKPRAPTTKTSNGAAARPALANVPVEQILKGYFVFKRPAQFIWAITQPYAQTLQADGQDFYIYDHDLQQLTHRAFDDAISRSSAAVLFGRGDWQRTFTLRDEGMQQGVDWVELRPKQEDSSFVRIRIGFHNATLSSMELHDTFGNVTYFTFHHWEINPILPKNQFTFHLPAGAEQVLQDGLYQKAVEFTETGGRDLRQAIMHDSGIVLDLLSASIKPNLCWALCFYISSHQARNR